MRLALHTVVCCCLFTVVLPLIRDERNTSLKRRFKLWLENHMNRDLSGSSAGAGDADIHVGAERDGKAVIASAAPSFSLNVRPRRSTSTSCRLSTCTSNHLLHEIYKSRNQAKNGKVPLNKLGPDGFGRRRRSLVPQLTARQRTSSEAGQRVCRHQSTCAAA